MIKQSSSVTSLDAFVRVQGLYLNNHPGSFKNAKYREGSYDPMWKSKIKDSISATTPLKAYEVSSSHSPGSATYSLAGSYPALDTDLGMNAFIPSWGNPYYAFWQYSNSLIREAQAKSRSRSLAKISSLQNRFSGQEFLGELRETVNLLRSPLRTSVRLIDSFKAFALTRNRASASAKALGDSWLEFRFGILPLISDIQKIVDIINSKQTLEKLGYRYYSKSDSVVMLPSRIGSEDLNVNIFGYDRDTAECIIHFGVVSERIHEASTSSERLLSTINQLSDLPSTAWELTPWSFLIDYFVNIGNIIDGATTGQQIVSYSSESNIYTQERYIRSLSVLSVVSYIESPVLKVPRTMSFKHRSVDRVGGSVAIPPLVLSLPGSNVRYANIAALLTKFL